MVDVGVMVRVAVAVGARVCVAVGGTGVSEGGAVSVGNGRVAVGGTFCGKEQAARIKVRRRGKVFRMRLLYRVLLLPHRNLYTDFTDSTENKFRNNLSCR